MKKLYKVILSFVIMLSAFLPVYADDSLKMWRLYNPNSGEHFYTSNEVERDNVYNAGWNIEGYGWISPSTSNTPVYRVYNPNAGDHHYTVSLEEKNILVNLGWRDEGIAWYACDEPTGVPIYREYNPNAIAGAHNFTTSKEEHDHLISLGWKDEGIAFYVLGVGSSEGSRDHSSSSNSSSSTTYNGPYIYSVNSKVFHRQVCPSVTNMKESNKRVSNSRNDLISRGFTACKNCNP